MATILIPLLILCPLVASLIAFVFAGRMGARGIGMVACAGVGLSAVISIILSVMLLSGAGTRVLQVTLWPWMHMPGLSADIAFMLDRVSMVMILIVTIVGLLIHVYAASYMYHDAGIARFFGCMTLFVAAMLLLVLASDLLCLFIGWEGVGLCSCLLIGFWYDNPANTAAARKAFYMTRMGDVALLCGLLLLATATGGSLRIGTVLAAVANGQVAPASVNMAALFILVGALAKSAQIPFQTWLPDAMAGPTPTSALIHAATMVTAGVYLIARLHGLFVMAVPVMALMAVLGALTLLMGACTALVQSDLKRILAWSTISQLGYMFLALGCGAWQAALFHLMTHAFFKALLFLTAGAIILRTRHEQDIFHLGGLRHAMPGLTTAFVAGASALAGLPLVTAGFYSKEMILSGVWAAHFTLTHGWTLSGHPLWGMALLGAFLTALYIFRCVFIVFCGKAGTRAVGRTSRLMSIPLGCLCVLSLFGGVIEMPDTRLPLHLFSALLDPAAVPSHAHEPAWLVLAGAGVPLAGLGVAWVLWGRPLPVMREIPGQASVIRPVRTGGGMDALYDHLFVQPFRLLVWLTRLDILNHAITGTGRLTRTASARIFRARAGFLDRLAIQATRMIGWADHLLGQCQNGRVRWYAAWIASGLCAGLAMAVLS
ncbi:NADH-quinone oxidoreductase subunit L [Komagataeibacter sp. FNDCF1]|uniref:NADH-quinone oxidoreductase subunit L n=1 Tax=Komagataeibacter sp. FNDCF1 TaxID=2878681 RepID=UPI001E552374|nr:NADH-quinone oxidoreductase subunit L [Komagataeibacter sp. FNDCF1]MCE2564571.1 NADH-quinone oxidoreductase subunit L [Komagataeibacter sp. FNDCF1]